MERHSKKFPLDFHAQTINVCPDGNLIIGGDGTLARYDLKGKELAVLNRPTWRRQKKIRRIETPRQRDTRGAA